MAGAKTFGFELTNHHVARAVLERIQPNKAQEYGYIPPRPVKASSQAIAQPLVIKLTRSLRKQRSRILGSMTRSHLITKKRSTLDKTNFRPVAVLPAFAKIFERIAHMQTTEHFEPIFHDFMFAYRKYHGCLTVPFTLTEHWKEELIKHKVIGALAMDLSKAFDCLPHDLALEKLEFTV